MRHPRVAVTDLETRTGTRFTAQTLEALRKLYPQQCFVWLMGADNLAGFHHWRHWDRIMQTVPVGVIARPGERGAARNSVAAQRFRKARLRGSEAALLGRASAPAWCLVNVPMVDQSSSAIRAAGGW